MAHIEIYTRPGCGYCTSAKQFLKMKGKSFIEYDVMRDQKRLPELLARTSNRTFPQIFIDGESIGGFTDLVALTNTANKTPNSTGALE